MIFYKGNMSETFSNKHPKALWYIMAIYMWEYFSFYGMRALLILYLTQELLLSDSKSYAVYGSFVALVYLTGINLVRATFAVRVTELWLCVFDCMADLHQARCRLGLAEATDSDVLCEHALVGR